jgi:hypothetical protein
VATEHRARVQRGPARPDLSAGGSPDAQHDPHANTPGEQTVAGLPASPHVTAHPVLPVQVVRQSPSHLTLQLDESAQVTVLPPPTCSLHVALVSHAAIDTAPSLKSQLELAVHVTRLPSPPLPLHSEESLQVTVSAPVVLPLHFADIVQLSEQSSSPHSVLQFAPATHAQAESVHVHPLPVQVGSEPPPQAAHIIAMQNRMIEPTLMSSTFRGSFPPAC